MGGLLKPEMNTLETGSGYSTVLFIQKGCNHTCVVPDHDEVERIRHYCTDEGIPLDRVKFLIGQSFHLLPSITENSHDIIFIDGAHRFPFPIVDWFYCAMILKEGGLIAIDDTDIVSCNILLTFMLDDPHWEKTEMRENFAIFRKKGGHDYPFDWLGQPFGKNKMCTGPQRLCSWMKLLSHYGYVARETVKRFIGISK